LKPLAWSRERARQWGIVLGGRVLAVCLLVGVAGGALIAFAKPLYVLAGMMGLIAALLVLSDAQWGLYAVIGVTTLLPFAAIPLNIGFNPTLLNLALLGLYFVWIVRVMTRTQEQLVGTELALPVLAFMLLAVFAFIAGLSHASLTKDTLRHFVELLLAIGVFFVVVNVIHEQSQLEDTVRVLMLCGFAAAAIGIFLWALPDDTALRLLRPLARLNYVVKLRYIEDNPSLPERAIGTSSDPNVFGGLLIIVTALTATQLFTRRPLLPRPLVWLMTGTMGACLVLTFSRGAMLGLVAALILIAFLRYRRLLWWVALGAVIILLLPQTQSYVAHFIEGLRGQDLATKMRFGEYKDALILISRYPWFGVGFAGTPDIDLYIGVSSFYLLLAEQMGLVGLGVFLVVISVFFATVMDAYRRTNDEQLAAILLGSTTALVGALVGGVFDHYFMNMDFPHAVTLFWMYVGLALTAARLGKMTAEAPAELLSS
jgi:O-antigen ligase